MDEHEPDFFYGNMPGLAWNDAKVLWAVIQGQHDDFLLAYKPDEDWAQVSQLESPEGHGTSFGLDIDECGNLWVAGALTGVVHLINSGIPAVPEDEPWLRASTESCNLDPASEDSDDTARVHSYLAGGSV